MLTNYEATGFDAPTFDLAAQIAGADTLESNLEVQFEKPAPMSRRDRKMRVLCLHGMFNALSFTFDTSLTMLPQASARAATSFA